MTRLRLDVCSIGLVADQCGCRGLHCRSFTSEVHRTPSALSHLTRVSPVAGVVWSGYRVSMTATELAEDLRKKVDAQHRLIDAARANGAVDADALDEIQLLFKQCKRAQQDLEAEIEDYHRHNKGVPDEIRGPNTLHDLQKAQRIVEQAASAALVATATPFIRTKRGRLIPVSTVSWDLDDEACTITAPSGVNQDEHDFEIVEVGGRTTNAWLKAQHDGPPVTIRAAPYTRRGK